MGDEHRGAAGDDPLERVAHERGGDRVEVGGRLVDEHERGIAQRDAGEREPPPLAGAGGDAALPHPGGEAARQRGRPRHRARRRRAPPTAARRRPRRRRGAGCRRASPAAAPAAAASTPSARATRRGPSRRARARRSGPSRDGPAAARAGRAAASTCRRRSARRPRWPRRARSPGTGRRAAGAPRPDTATVTCSSTIASDARVGDGAAGRPGHDPLRRARDLEQALQGRPRVGRRVVLDAGAPQRAVDLRGEQEHDERVLERHRAVDEADAGDDGHERRPEHRDELEREAAHERRPQRADGRAAIGVTGDGELLALHLLAPEAAQHRQPAGDVEQVRAEQRHRGEALVGDALRVAAREHEEDDQQRQRRHQQRRAQRIARDDHGERDDGHEHRQRGLRQHAPRPALDRRAALGGERGELAGAAAAAIRAAGRQRRADEARAQVRHRRAPGAPPAHLRDPGERGADRDRGQERPRRGRGRGPAAPVDARRRPRRRGRSPGRRSPRRRPADSTPATTACRRSAGMLAQTDGSRRAHGVSGSRRSSRSSGVFTSPGPVRRDPRAEHPVGPALVEEHDRRHDDRDDGHDHQRLVGRRGGGDAEVRPGPRGHHHVRVQRREQQHDGARDRHRREGERRALAPGAVHRDDRDERHRGHARRRDRQRAHDLGVERASRPRRRRRPRRSGATARWPPRCARSRTGPCGAEREEVRAVQREQQQRRQRRRGSCTGRSRSRKLPANAAVLGERAAADDVGERDAPQQRRRRAGGDDRGVPAAPPHRIVVLVAVLERHDPHDQRDQDQRQRQVEAAEQRRVPLREGGEGGAAGDQQPHLVAVPHRARSSGSPAPRSDSVRPTTCSSVPTPKSKPSRIR